MVRLFSHYISVKTFLLILLESGLIALSLICATELRFWNRPDDLAAYLVLPDFAVQLAIVVAVCITCFYCNDLYETAGASVSVEAMLRVPQALGAASLLLGLVYFLFPELLLSRGVFLIGMILSGGFVIVGRKCVDSAWRLTAPIRHVAILGTGELAFNVARELTGRRDLNLNLLGFINTAPEQRPETSIFGFPLIGSITELEELASRYRLSSIIVALEDRRGLLPARELVTLRVSGLRIDDAATALSALTGRVSLRAVRPSWFVFSEGFHRSRVNDLLKRLIDLAVGIFGLLISLPVMAAVALAVRLDSKGPIIYRQTRVGLKNKTFGLLKFRSMRVDAEAAGTAQWASRNDPRVTRIGRFLRKYRLDELPQFINVISGDMSLVGPRPERPSFVTMLREQIPYYDERHSARPGLTGWAQVCYSYGSSVEDSAAKLEYDLFYLKNMSLLFDVAIIFRTVRIVINGQGGR